MSIPGPVAPTTDLGDEGPVQSSGAGAAGLMTVDGGWRCRSANAEAAAVVGRRPDELCGLPWTNFAADEHLVGLVEALSEAAGTGAPAVVTHDIERFYAEDRSVELTIVPIPPGDRGLLNFAVSIREIPGPSEPPPDLEPTSTGPTVQPLDGSDVDAPADRTIEQRRRRGSGDCLPMRRSRPPRRDRDLVVDGGGQSP